MRDSQSRQMRNAKRVALLVSLLVIGCSSDSSEKPQLSCPHEISIEGINWKKVTLSDKNKRDLNRYFRQHPELRDHPILEGVLMLYSDGQGTLRFYWIQPAKGGHSWLFLEQDRQSRFVRAHEGSGEPFP